MRTSSRCTSRNLPGRDSQRNEDVHESQGRLQRPEDEVFAEYLSSRNVEDPAVVGLFRELLDQVDAT